MYEDFLKEAENFIFVENEPEPADIIFVPGNGYPQMAERAAVLYKEGYAPYILPSGRYSITNGKFAGVLAKGEKYNGDYDTEWEFLADVLIKNGVPKQAVLKEDRATYTYENAIFSRQVTDRMGLQVRKAILCCKSYHARRALMYYQRLFPEAEILVCPSCTDSISKNNWKDTEKGIDEVTGEITRIIKQFSLMMK
ncbi:MAG: YdcF family protein [Eubacteriales bacterium]|nr:YdcF family protein [Eubacteriales bacterium]